MLKNITSLTHKIGERIYHLFCDQDSPITEVKESLSQFMGFAVQVENAALEAQAKEKADAEVPTTEAPIEDAPKE